MYATPSRSFAARFLYAARRLRMTLPLFAVLAFAAQPQHHVLAQQAGAAQAGQQAPKAPPATAEKQVDQERQPGSGAHTPPKTLNPAPAAKKPSAKSGGCGQSQNSGANLPPLKPDPNQTGTPKYVCAQPEVKVEGVWAGKPLTFDFSIANQGTADLVIKLKGG